MRGALGARDQDGFPLLSALSSVATLKGDAMEKTRAALQHLRGLLTEALELTKRDDLCADTLKDWHYTVAQAFRPAIEELRKQEEPQPHWTDKRDCSGVG